MAITIQEYETRLTEAVEHIDGIVGVLDRVSKTATTEPVQQALANRKNVAAARLNQVIETLDDEYLDTEETEE